MKAWLEHTGAFNKSIDDSDVILVQQKQLFILYHFICFVTMSRCKLFIFSRKATHWVRYVKLDGLL